MPRVKYEYDGSTGTETTANFSAGEETAQDALDTANQSDYASKIMQMTTTMGDNMRSLMEVI
jgi:hypothetical protein